MMKCLVFIQFHYAFCYDTEHDLVERLGIMKIGSCCKEQLRTHNALMVLLTFKIYITHHKDCAAQTP